MPEGHRRLHLSKHEGAGNDFLVVLDAEDALALTASEVRVLCDRHRGVGADGVVRGVPRHDTADLWMELRNADGTEAETSGNGLRCLAQASVEAGLVPATFRVATGAGVRAIEYTGDPTSPGLGRASVDMGLVHLGDEEPSPLPGWRARAAEAGNPHVVLVPVAGSAADLDGLDLRGVAQAVAGGRAGGVNVELVAPGRGPDALVLRVFERGVGETLACGTGSCAAVAVAEAWGLTGRRVQVHNPGGMVEVDLGDKEGDPVRLAGPVRKVAEVTVDRRWLL